MGRLRGFVLKPRSGWQLRLMHSGAEFGTEFGVRWAVFYTLAPALLGDTAHALKVPAGLNVAISLGAWSVGVMLHVWHDALVRRIDDPTHSS